MTTNEFYLIMKARKEFLINQINNFTNMQFFNSNNREKILQGLEMELDLVQSKIDDLIW